MMPESEWAEDLKALEEALGYMPELDENGDPLIFETHGDAKGLTLPLGEMIESGEKQLLGTHPLRTLPNYDVVLKQADAPLVAGVRDTLSSYPEVGRLFYDHLTRFGANGRSLTGAAIWHDDEYKTSDIDGEAVVYLYDCVGEGRTATRGF